VGSDISPSSGFPSLEAISQRDGAVRLRGRDITWAPPHAIAAGGIARRFQSCRLVGSITALDSAADTLRNAFLGGG